MAHEFGIKFHRSRGNLHLHPHGSLDAGSAWQLINFIQTQYSGQGNVFVNTKDLTEILPFGSQVFRNNFDQGIVPPGNLYFKGEKGKEIAPPGCRVLAWRRPLKCRCKKRCGHCGCDQVHPRSGAPMEKNEDN